MTIPLTGTGGLFTRVGTVGGFLNDINTFLGTSGVPTGLKTVGPATDAINAQYATTDQILVSGLYPARDSYRQVHNTMTAYLQSLAQSTVTTMANDDRPLAQQTLASAMAYLIGQMVTAAQTVAKPTVSATPTAGGSNVGTGVLSGSVLGNNGVQSDYAYNETIIGTCTTDGQSGGVAGQETFLFTSPAPQQNTLFWNWPIGTGISTSLTATDGQLSSSGGNLGNNSSWNTWTNPSVGPDNWLIQVGTVGTGIVQATGANVYKGTSDLGYVGDAATLFSISQPFGATPSTAGNSGGSASTLSPLTQYALNLWLKVSVVPAAGVLAIDLTDGSNNVVNDANGVPNTLSFTLTGATTSFVPHQAFFRTPAVIPANGFRLRVRLTTALSSGTTLYLGNMALSKASQLYPGGPFVGLFSGATNFIKNDVQNLAVANNYGSKWQFLAEQVWGMRAMGLQLPSSGSPTILDSLIA